MSHPVNNSAAPTNETEFPRAEGRNCRTVSSCQGSLLVSLALCHVGTDLGLGEIPKAILASLTNPLFPLKTPCLVPSRAAAVTDGEEGPQLLLQALLGTNKPHALGAVLCCGGRLARDSL